VYKRQKLVLYLEDIYVNGVTDYDYGNKIAVGKIVFTSKWSIQGLKEDLNAIRAQLIRETEDRKIEGLIESFMPVAARYRSMIDKPVITEAQRKKVIESELFSSEGKYQDAIKSLLSALEIDPVSYPQGYYNLAFLYERVGNFAGSILNMKKYILLDPFAEDARASQDKIYEWELKRKK
jgi:tetratricopeptide (TPR) repeat protein